MRKKIGFILMIVTSIFTSCGIDNYDEPNATFEGSFVTSDGYVVPQRVSGATATRINLYEAKNSTSLPVQFYTKHDGTFKNSMIFGQDFRMIIDQQNFLPIEESVISITGTTVHNFEVVPFCEVTNVSAQYNTSTKEITVKYTISKDGTISDGGGVVDATSLYVNTSQYVDDQAANYINSSSFDMTTEVLDTEIENNIAIEETSENTLYVRVGVRSQYDDNTYMNFSEVIPVEIN